MAVNINYKIKSDMAPPNLTFLEYMSDVVIGMNYVFTSELDLSNTIANLAYEDHELKISYLNESDFNSVISTIRNSTFTFNETDYLVEVQATFDTEEIYNILKGKHISYSNEMYPYPITYEEIAINPVI